MKALNDTSILDSREKMAQLDKSNILGSIEAFADQVKHAWEETQKLELSLDASKIRNIVVSGMGGSGLGPDIFKHLFMENLPVSFEIYNSYTLPAYVNEHTLVVLASYSGTTEETIACAQAVEKTGAQVLVITTGGTLAKIAEEKQYPAYIINPLYNPSNQPRMAIGYAATALMGILAKAGLIEVTAEHIDEVITTIIRTAEKLGIEVPQQENQAKLLAFTCVERRPIFVVSEFLAGAAHAAANQFNESAKIFADYKLVPEINHHLMEGLQFPKTNAGSHVFFFFNSSLYLPRNQKRMKLTQEVVENNGIDTLGIELTADTKMAQVFELMTLLLYANFYVGALENINPGPVPYVDWFKEQLGK